MIIMYGICALLGAVSSVLIISRLITFWKSNNKRFKARQFLYLSTAICLLSLALFEIFSKNF